MSALFLLDAAKKDRPSFRHSTPNNISKSQGVRDADSDIQKMTKYVIEHNITYCR